MLRARFANAGKESRYGIVAFGRGQKLEANVLVKLVKLNLARRLDVYGGVVGEV